MRPIATQSQFDKAAFDRAPMGAFAKWAAHEAGQSFDDYEQLHRWSVESPREFWGIVWRYFGVRASRAYEKVMSDDPMPRTKWFPGARLNYVDMVLRHADRDGVAVVAVAENGDRAELTWTELVAQVTSLAATLRKLGVTPGARVVGNLTSGIEAIVSFLATAAIGATWACCGPDYGASAAADRLEQLGPSVLIANTAYRFNGICFDRRGPVAELVRRLGGALPVVEVTREGVVFDRGAFRGDVIPWGEAVGARNLGRLQTEQVAPDHPLWILFSSGTTGIPKGIVHGHAGAVVNHLAFLGLMVGLTPDSRFFWYTTTNWMMWNLVASALLIGASAVTYEGSPSVPSIDRLWQIVADEAVTVFGTNPGQLQLSKSAGLRPRDDHDLSRLVQLGATGSPVPAHLYHWAADAVGPDVPLAVTSGGTDAVSGFLAWTAGLPVYPGEMSAAALGVAVDVFDESGESVINEVGELVITRPLPSMPVRFWNDPDYSRYRDAYFGVYPGVWCHGDWATHTSRDSYVIHGRSDATLNRGGVRIGSSDLYRVVEALPEIAEALVVGVELPGGGYRMPMFLVLTDGVRLGAELEDELRRRLRTQASPRHIPDQFVAVPALPHTKTGKKIEVPIKRILQGADPAAVVSAGAIDRPELIEPYVALARDWLSKSGNTERGE